MQYKIAVLGAAAFALAACGHAKQMTIHLRPTTTAHQQSWEQKTRCTEDMPCWDCHTMGNHVCGSDWSTVSTAPSCGWINGSEFPRLAGRVYGQCWANINHQHEFRYVGRYDGHRDVWQIIGPTSVYVTHEGWFETS